MKFSKNYLTLPFYIPRIVSVLTNWQLYLKNYLFRIHQPAEYAFRNGYRLRDNAGTMAGTLAVVFIRKEYGPISNYKTIVDIGANLGCFMLYAAHSCPDADIYCYEPVQHNYTNLKYNIVLNNLEDRVHAVQSAVAANRGQTVITLDISNLHSFYMNTGSSNHEKVDCITINDIFKAHGLKKIDLLKINCEGAEYEILENCSPDDFNRILNIRLEYHNLNEPGKNGVSLRHSLEKQGYEIHHFTRYRGESGFIWASRKYK